MSKKRTTKKRPTLMKAWLATDKNGKVAKWRFCDGQTVFVALARKPKQPSTYRQFTLVPVRKAKR